MIRKPVRDLAPGDRFVIGRVGPYTVVEVVPGSPYCRLVVEERPDRDVRLQGAEIVYVDAPEEDETGGTWADADAAADRVERYLDCHGRLRGPIDHERLGRTIVTVDGEQIEADLLASDLRLLVAAVRETLPS